MNNLRQAAQQALEALERINAIHYLQDLYEALDWEIDALRAALAEPEQEPVCDKDPGGCWNVRCQLGKVCKNTAPTLRKPLTDEEMPTLFVGGLALNSEATTEIVRAVEKAHGIGEQHE